MSVALGRPSVSPPRPGQEEKPIDVVTTDAEGRFSFSSVPGGAFVLLAKKDGYLPGAFGKARYYDTGKPLDLQESKNDVEILLWRQPVITGIVRDENDSPVARAKVSILQRQTIGGRLMLVAKTTALTDDRGVFRSLAEAPGDYTACVPSVQIALPTPLYSNYFTGRLLVDRHMRRQLSSLGPEPPRPGSPNVTNRDQFVQISSVPNSPSSDAGYRTVCSPSVDPSGAQTVLVGFGETSPQVQVRLKLTRSVTVSGNLVGQSSQTANTALRLVDLNLLTSLFSDVGFETAATVTDSNGNFRFFGVPPGQYKVEAFVMSSDSESTTGTATGLKWISQVIAVPDKDVEDLKLELHDGFRLVGRIVRADTVDPVKQPAPSAFTLQLEPANGRLGGLSTSAKADGSFQFPDVKPGRYLLKAIAPPAGWALRSVLLNGRDVSEEPFDISEVALGEAVVTLTNRPTNVRVTAYGKNGQPDALASVIMVATDRRYWVDYGWSPRRLASARPDSTGVAEIVGMPPGTYFVAALSSDRTSKLTLIEISEAVSREGQKIELREAEPLQLRAPVDGGK